MLVRTYKCTVCGQSCKTLMDWLSHLVQEGHLRMARQGLLNWGAKERASTLVVFGMSPVGRNVSIPRHFSEGELGLFKGDRIIVEDFVWWPERPNVGFLRFKNRRALDQVIASVTEVVVIGEEENEQSCHLKVAAEMSEMEWLGLLPPDAGVSEAMSSLHLEVKVLPTPKKRKAPVVNLVAPKKKRKTNKSGGCRCQRKGVKKNPPKVKVEQQEQNQIATKEVPGTSRSNF